jgi:APA family basic amino acid/polyamine antiporter
MNALDALTSTKILGATHYSDVSDVCEGSRMHRQWFARKSLKTLLADMESDNRLKRALGPVTLTSLGIGAVIGAGIFVATGEAARNTAGPALMISYMVAGLACIFAALCYAEFASMAPVAGSAYTYAYTTLGELFAWIIGWDLVLEYAVGAATVANGWSGYFQKVLKGLHLTFPDSIGKAPLEWNHSAAWTDPGNWVTLTGSYVNLPAVIIVFIMTAILVKGISESANFNALMVFIKVGAVLFVVLVGAFFVNSANWTESVAPDGRGGFAPYGWGGFSFFGFEQFTIGQRVEGRPVGMLAGAAIIFFAYIGFDSVSTHAEEARNPQRDVPIGIVASLIICTILYVAVVAVLTGMVPYYKIDPNAGVSSAFAERNLRWAEFIIAAAGVAGITSVLLVMMLSGPRVFLAMARDGLVPKAFFADIHPTFRTPWKSTIAIGLFVAILAGLLPINALLELTNIGTLFAFVVVCAAVLVMRRIDPTANRPFRCPLVPVIPLLGIVLCLMLMMSLPVGNWLRLIGWMALGLCIYFFYGMRHSTLGHELKDAISHKPI